MGMEGESVTGVPSGEVTPGSLMELSGRGTTGTQKRAIQPLAYIPNRNHESQRDSRAKAWREMRAAAPRRAVTKWTMLDY